jgi:single-stranded-DNA-specific exonuclease
LNHRRWKILPSAPAGFLAELGLPALAAQLLHNRGITEATEAQAFLARDDSLQGDPFLLPDMEKAVARVYQAMLRGESIAVYGDFDADGICGTVLLSQGLSLLGANVIPYIPHRVEEGYGLNSPSLGRLSQQGVTLVLTVDCGISDVEEVDYARTLGMEVIITDHHSVLHGLPKAVAVVNPKRRESSYPFRELAGVGVAYKFLQALFMTLGKDEALDGMLDVVTVGTVADMVPLVGENRSLVKRGLKELGKTQRIGFQEMMRLSGLQSKELDSEQISWIIAPRLNAPGRLDDAVAGYRLLTTDSLQEAQELAQLLEEVNSKRQKVTSELFVEAKEQLAAGGADAPLLMVGGEHYLPGVAGLVAGKLVGEYYRPALVYEMGDEVSRGSARSIPEFDVVGALGECRDLLLRFGGHPMAAGFALRNENLQQFQHDLLQIASDRLSALDLQPVVAVEAELALSAVNGEVLKLIDSLAPFGTGNPVPVFVSRGVQVLECDTVGNGSKHLRLKLRQGGVVWRAIGFDLGHLAGEVTRHIDIVYSFSVDRWGGRDTLQLSILDFAPDR